MKAIKTYLRLLLLLPLITACEKVVNIDLNTADPKLVIDGRVTDTSGKYQVILSKSQSFYSDQAPPKVSGAIVIISDQQGSIIDTLHEDSAGVYNTRLLRKGQPLHTYTLTVKAENKNYSSVSTMPDSVKIDSLHFTPAGEGRRGFRNNSNPMVTCYWTDPSATANYYRVDIFKDDTLINDKRYSILNDQFTNGTQLQFSFSRNALVKGTVVKFRIYSIDKATYDYYNGVNLVLGSGQASLAPANPNTVMQGGALGYFTAMSSSTRVKVIK
jgi:hypothetical protein